MSFAPASLRRPQPPNSTRPPVWLQTLTTRGYPGRLDSASTDALVAIYARPQLANGATCLLRAAYVASQRLPRLRFQMTLLGADLAEVERFGQRLGIGPRFTVQAASPVDSLASVAADAQVVVLESVPFDATLGDVANLSRDVPLIVNPLLGGIGLPQDVLQLDFWDPRRLGDGIAYQATRPVAAAASRSSARRA